jgi:hypothetical protein
MRTQGHTPNRFESCMVAALFSNVAEDGTLVTKTLKEADVDKYSIETVVRGGPTDLDSLITEGYFQHPDQRAVVDALKQRGDEVLIVGITCPNGRGRQLRLGLGTN